MIARSIPAEGLCAMARGPYGIVGLLVVVILIIILLRLLGFF